MTDTFATVWDAIGDTPEETAAMKMRADIMIAITNKVRAWDITQREAARRLGITQPRVNDLLAGKFSKFSLDALVSLAPHAGLGLRLSVVPQRITAKRSIAAVGVRAAKQRSRSKATTAHKIAARSKSATGRARRGG